MSATEPTARSVASWWRHLPEEITRERLTERLTEGSIHEAAHATAVSRPRAPAVSVSGESSTHESLDLRARSVATWLAARGSGPGQRVVLALGNSVDYVVSYLAILHTGAAVVLVNPMLTERELAVVVEDSDPVAAVGDTGRADQLSDLGVPVVLRDRDVAGVCESSDPIEVRRTDPAAIAHVAFTSGTTGRPKPTPLTHANVLASMRSIIWAWRIDAGDTVVHALPLQHAHGLSGVHSVLLTGCHGSFMDAFDPYELCAEVARERATVMFAVPAMWERLVESGELARGGLSGLRLATSGSAALSPATSGAVAELTGKRPLERYGLTETGFVISNPYEGERRAGSVGIPLPGAEVGIADGDGRWVDDGNVGEILLRGSSVFAGYLGTAASPESAMQASREGWFATGDLAVVDPADGYVSIVGRSKEMILTGGLNVYPREVELVLESLPGVSQAAVVGIPSKRWGEEVTAFVVPTGGARLDAEQLSLGASEQLAAYKRPKTYRMVAELPRNHMGKIVRSALRQLAGPGETPRVE